MNRKFGDVCNVLLQIGHTSVAVALLASMWTTYVVISRRFSRCAAELVVLDEGEKILNPTSPRRRGSRIKCRDIGEHSPQRVSRGGLVLRLVQYLSHKKTTSTCDMECSWIDDCFLTRTSPVSKLYGIRARFGDLRGLLRDRLFLQSVMPVHWSSTRLLSKSIDAKHVASIASAALTLKKSLEVFQFHALSPYML